MSIRILFTLFAMVLSASIALVFMRLANAYILAYFFVNNRFVGSYFGYFYDTPKSLSFLSQNIAFALALIIIPIICFVLTKIIMWRFMLTYTVTAFFLAALASLFYLNLANITMTKLYFFTHIFIFPLLCLVIPILFSYGAYSLIWHSRLKIKI